MCLFLFLSSFSMQRKKPYLIRWLYARIYFDLFTIWTYSRREEEEEEEKEKMKRKQELKQQLVRLIIEKKVFEVGDDTVSCLQR